MPQLILLEPLTEHVFMAPLAALAAQYIFHIPVYISLPAHIVCWCIMDYILAAVCEVGSLIEVILSSLYSCKCTDFIGTLYKILVCCISNVDRLS